MACLIFKMAAVTNVLALLIFLLQTFLQISATPGNDYMEEDTSSISNLPSVRGVGTTAAAEKQFPYQLYWKYKKKFGCGATLVEVYAIHIAITSARCLWKGWPYQMSMKEAELMRVIAGDKRRNTTSGPEQWRNVAKVVAHPDYDPAFDAHDIAILFLSSDFKVTDHVDPVLLPEHDWGTPSKVTVSGWGAKARWKKVNDYLHFIELPTHSRERCHDLNKIPWIEISDNQFCAGEWYSEKNKGTCKGDRGGPGVAKNGSRLYLAGVISFATSLTCGHPHFPTVLTHVAKYVDWIRIEVSKYREDNNL